MLILKQTYVILFVLFMSTSARAVLPTNMFYKDLKDTYKESTLFTSEKYPETPENCYDIANRASDIAILYLIHNLKARNYTNNMCAERTYEQYNLCHTQVLALQDLVIKTAPVHWADTDWYLSYVHLIKSFVYNRCIEHLNNIKGDDNG